MTTPPLFDAEVKERAELLRITLSHPCLRVILQGELAVRIMSSLTLRRPRPCTKLVGREYI